MATVAVLGAGNVGRTLAARVIHGGGVVRFGVRDADKARAELSGLLAECFVGSAADAAASADIVIVTVPANAELAAVQGAGDLSGKIVVDATNPLRWDSGPVWTPPAEGSMAAALATALPGARVVKGFNHFGVEIMANPADADAFFASDDAAARAEVMQLATTMGFTARDAGPLRNAAVLENMAVLWIHLATVGGAGRQFAFAMQPR